MQKKFSNQIEFEKDKKKFFQLLNSAEKSRVLITTTPTIKKQLLNSLYDDEILEIFRYLDPDEIVDLLELLHKTKEKRILNKLSDSQREKIDFLSEFSSESAAGVMNLNYILIRYGTKKNEILQRINHHLELTQKEPIILVVDEFGHLLGELLITTLLLKTNNTLYNNLKEPPTISSQEDQEHCIEIFRKHLAEHIVVLDEEGFVVGIIKGKQMLKVIEQENEEDYFGLAGLKREEEVNAKGTDKVRSRLSWLLVNLVTAFLAAFVVFFYEETIAKYVLLAVFMPVIAGMGGNAGTQTTAILIRGIALNKVHFGVRTIFLSEIFGALINGVLIGVLVGGVALLFGSSFLFAIIAFVAIVLNLLLASAFGTIIPVVLKKFGVDPAVASNVFVTTITDVFGFFIFLGLATIFLI